MIKKRSKILLTTHDFNRIRVHYEDIQLRTSDFNYYILFASLARSKSSRFKSKNKKRKIIQFHISYYRLLYKKLFFNTTLFSIILNNLIQDVNIKNMKKLSLLYHFIFFIKHDLNFIYYFNFFFKYLTSVYSLKGRKLREYNQWFVNTFLFHALESYSEASLITSEVVPFLPAFKNLYRLSSYMSGFVTSLFFNIYSIFAFVKFSTLSLFSFFYKTRFGAFKKTFRYVSFWIQPIHYINISLFHTFKSLKFDKEWKTNFNFNQFFKFWFRKRLNVVNTRLRFFSLLQLIGYYSFKLFIKNVNFNHKKINHKNIIKVFSIPKRSRSALTVFNQENTYLNSFRWRKNFFKNYKKKRGYRKKMIKFVLTKSSKFVTINKPKNFFFYFKDFLNLQTFKTFKRSKKLLNKDKNFNTLVSNPSNLQYTYNTNQIQSIKPFNYSTALHRIYRQHRLSTFYSILWNFRMLVSKLLNIEPIREVIIKYHKKRIRSSLIFKLNQRTPKRQYLHLFKNFIFERTNLSRKKRTNRAIWVSKTTPKSFFIPRLQFFYNLRKRFQYQNRLTQYITRFYRLQVLELARISEFKVLNILLRSQFFFNENIIFEFIKKQLVYINGYLCATSFTVLSPHDVLQIVPSSNFFLYYKWNIIFLNARLNRFFYFTRYWVRRSFRTYPKESSRRIPHWVIYRKFSFYEIPNYFEVDFLTLTVILLNTYYWSVNYYHYYTFRETPFATIRNHNWKFLT